MADLKTENAIVKLKAKDSEKKEITRPIEVANKLLGFPNSQWELKDDAYIWNGKELAVKNAVAEPKK